MLAFLGIFYVLFLAVVSALLNGWVFSKLWLWFIVPVFELPVLNIPSAIGIGTVVSFLTYQYFQTKSDPDETTGMAVFRATVYTVLRPLMVLLFGYIVLQFM